MILDISYRTDIPAFYSDWLYNRFKEGYILQRNPRSINTLSKIKLDNTIDIIVFCSKNYMPFMKYINYFEQNWRCVYHYTITSYGNDIEPNVPNILDAINNFKEISNIVGKDRIIWRYDPILFNNKYTLEYHKKFLKFMFTHEQIQNYTNKCIFSFCSTIYPIVKKNIPDIINGPRDEMLLYLEELSKKYGVTFQTCGHGIDFIDKHPLIKKSGCQTIEDFEDIFDIKFKKTYLGNKRPGCLCIDGRSIGDYGTCYHGCKYCYAERKTGIIGKHNKQSPLFIGEISKDDKIIDTKQKSDIIENKQLELGFNF